MSATISHARILVLLELVETHERGARPFRIDEIHDESETAWAELRWLDQQSLANLTSRSAENGALRACLTPFGRSTLSLIRGDVSRSEGPDSPPTREFG